LNRNRLRKLGWNVLVVWECHTALGQRGKLVTKLRTFLDSRAIEHESRLS
jgi:G:T-mismatch repair DNA endonuclease (very short patch repair protein)